MPKISVVIPVYKVEEYIYRCIDSILLQVFTDYELILVDDGSNDNCGCICDEFSQLESSIIVIHKKNGGLSDARNVGINWSCISSDSDWITFVDSDDWIHPRYLEILYHVAVKQGSNLSICGYREVVDNNPFIDVSKGKTEIVSTEIFFCKHNVNAIVAWGKLYRKNFFTDIRYPVGKLHEDEFTTFRIIFQNETCVFFNLPLYYYYQNNNSITQSRWTLRRLDAYDALLAQIDYFHSNSFFMAEGYVFTNYSCYLKLLENKKEFMDNYNHVYRKYKHELRIRLLKYRPNIQNCPYAYEYLFPRLTNVYWMVISQLNKVKEKKLKWRL